MILNEICCDVCGKVVAEIKPGFIKTISVERKFLVCKIHEYFYDKVSEAHVCSDCINEIRNAIQKKGAEQMKTRYIIIHSWSIKDVEQQVNEAMTGGHFIPTGGIEFDGKEFYQAMVINQIPTCSCRKDKKEQSK